MQLGFATIPRRIPPTGGAGYLLDFDHGGAVVTSVPHARDFAFWKRRLAAHGPNVIPDIVSHVDGLLAAGDVHVTSWMPGSDWSLTVLDPIYLVATRRSVVQSGWCFGLFVCECVLDRCQTLGERWGFNHTNDQWGNPIKGRCYFRLP